ncbi:hypothetical protein D3871_13755 [Noviherbaspirillum saxi]|uniref:4-amino-4-deoxy-L-arabinose transferase n=2 Tax=Noviherbaspirillum saxi TaxID=2320863 RepID=A0A3A3FTG3_9BURK|nr:hypothetical protein D3871_13755 [Noviherbaspirillum saxi]
MPVFIGLLAFTGFTGGAILNPLNVDWILSAGGDSLQHYIGWNFFRNEPFFQYPFGKTYGFGETLSSSIVFSDSIPIFAFVFRIFSGLLPQQFQYFGLWICACFILQSIFAWRLLSRFTNDVFLLCLSTSFFALAPMMLWRLSVHAALAGHWVILAALDVYFDERAKKRHWALLTGLTCLIHAYLLAMVGAIWLTDLIRRVVARKMRASSGLAELALIFLVIGVVATSAGYFMLGASPTQAGFGYFRLNLLEPIRPSLDWPIFGDTSLPHGDYEGFTYLGPGLWLLCVLAAVLWFKGKREGKLADGIVPLCILGIGFLLFALSNQVAFGPRELFAYSYPAFLEPFTGTFRASGRFAWPVVYMLLLALFAVYLKSMPRNAAIAILTLLFVVQAIDLSDESGRLRQRWSTNWKTPLASPFWDEVPKLYRRIAFVTPGFLTPNYGPLALLASDNRMSVNGGYFARIDPIKLSSAKEELRAAMEAGRFRSDTLYVFNDRALWAEAVDNFNQDGFIGSVDQLNIVAPGYRGCLTACGLKDPEPPQRYELDSVLEFGSGGGIEQYAREGWHMPEGDGRWTDGNKAKVSMTLNSSDAESYKLQLKFLPFVATPHPTQRVTVLVNGHLSAKWELSNANEAIKNIHVDGASIRSRNGKVSIVFSLPDAASPRSVAFNEDERAIGIFVKSMKLSVASTELASQINK